MGRSSCFHSQKTHQLSFLVSNCNQQCWLFSVPNIAGCRLVSILENFGCCA